MRLRTVKSCGMTMPSFIGERLNVSEEVREGRRTVVERRVTRVPVRVRMPFKASERDDDRASVDVEAGGDRREEHSSRPAFMAVSVSCKERRSQDSSEAVVCWRTDGSWEAGMGG